MCLEGMDAHQDKAIRKKYYSALMSDHKWRKLFLVMAEHGSDFFAVSNIALSIKKVYFLAVLHQ